jgi:hypothetical protein
MSIPTRLDVKTRFRALLADPNGVRFTDALFAQGFVEAYESLFNTFMNQQIPRIKAIAPATLSVGATSMSPSVAGFTDFGEIEEVEERLSGSTEKYTRVYPRDTLDQRDKGPVLGEYVWRMDTLYFIGATTLRELLITYQSSGLAPTLDATSIAVEGALTFLAKASAAAVAATKGLDEIALRYKLEAYGPRWDEGIAGGELLRLCKGRIRTMQHVQLAPKPFSTTRRLAARRAPFIAAQTTGSGGTSNVPAQFSSYAGTVTGTIDGTNDTFYLPYPVTEVNVFLNGIRLTETSQFTHSANQIVFIAPYLPQPSAAIVVDGWV